MEKQYKLTDRVSKDSLKSPTFKKWLKRVLCLVCILSLVLQLTLCCIPMSASAEESVVGTWKFNDVIVKPSFITSSSYKKPLDYTYTDNNGNVITCNYISFSFDSSGLSAMYYFPSSGSSSVYVWSKFSFWQINSHEITILSEPNIDGFSAWLNANATRVVTTVYDFTGEYRLFNVQLTNLSFAQSGTVTQTYQFDYQIWNGYSADYFTVQASGSQVDISYAFTDEGSGGVTTVYRQLFRNGQKVGTWLVPRARLIYFESNPDDPTFQQWLLDNTVLVDESMIQTVYDFGYNNGFNDGWTDNLIGDTLNAPIQALNNIILLQVGNTVITLGGVIFTMIVLCILIVFLKKFAGG